MIPRLFLDTNILLDILLARQGYESGLELLQAGVDGAVSLHTSVLSMANIAYLLRKDQSGLVLPPTMKQISSLLDILPMNQDQFHRALFLAGPDFEDILQAVCAEAGDCSVIVTHNPRHFHIRKGLLEDWACPAVMTPEEYLMPRPDSH